MKFNPNQGIMPICIYPHFQSAIYKNRIKSADSYALSIARIRTTVNTDK